MVLNDIPSLNNPSAIFMLCTLLILYSPSAVLFNTCLSYIFDKMDSAQSIMPNITTWVGVIPFILVAVLDTFKWGKFNYFIRLRYYFIRSALLLQNLCMYLYFVLCFCKCDLNMSKCDIMFAGSDTAFYLHVFFSFVDVMYIPYAIIYYVDR